MQDIFHFALQHIWLTSALVVLIILFIGNEMFHQSVSAKKISSSQAITLMNRQGAILIDIRDKADYRQGHIAGAQNAIFTQIETQQTQFAKDKPLIIVCKIGQTAAKAADLLKKQGYTEVYVLNGGMQTWRAEGLPVVTD